MARFPELLGLLAPADHNPIPALVQHLLTDLLPRHVHTLLIWRGAYQIHLQGARLLAEPLLWSRTSSYPPHGALLAAAIPSLTVGSTVPDK